MENALVNQDFLRSLKRMRAVLPAFAFILLIGTYLISAFIMGLFHAASNDTPGFTIAAFLVPLVIQAGRGALVFFFQLNPLRIQTQFSFGVIAATALLVLSLCEAVLVMLPYGLSWTVSVSTLMLIGWVIEIMLLREAWFTTQLELFQNKERWQEMKDFYIAQYEIKQFMHELHRKALPERRSFQVIRTERKKALDNTGVKNDTNSSIMGNG